MKRISLVFLILFSFFTLFPDIAETTLLTLKYQAVAIGEISLAYRLETLTMSLAAAKAVDKEYITAILDEVDATVSNGKSIILVRNIAPDPLTKEIISAFDQLLKCSGEIKKYSSGDKTVSAEQISKCMELSRKKLDLLSEIYNKKQNKNNVNQQKQR
ncbi:hypothetical protein IKP13_02285 [bacterium]|nr:hypothetical protein [bacterium]